MNDIHRGHSFDPPKLHHRFREVAEHPAYRRCRWPTALRAGAGNSPRHLDDRATRGGASPRIGRDLTTATARSSLPERSLIRTRPLASSRVVTVRGTRCARSRRTVSCLGAWNTTPGRSRWRALSDSMSHARTTPGRGSNAAIQFRSTTLLANLRNDERVEFQIVSHACFAARHGGIELLVDPWLLGSRSLAQLVESAGAGPEIVARLEPDFIYLTHLHWDHFHGPSLRRFAPARACSCPSCTTRRMVETRVSGSPRSWNSDHGKTYYSAARFASRAINRVSARTLCSS